jgi:two-component system sensor histidine kinase KdpD
MCQGRVKARCLSVKVSSRSLISGWFGDALASEMTPGHQRHALAAPFALPAGFAALFGVGTVAAALHGMLSAPGVLIGCAAVVGVVSLLSEPVAAAPLSAIGWLTAVGFSRPPYGDLRPDGVVALHAGIAMGVSAALGACLGALHRWSTARVTLGNVDVSTDSSRSAASWQPGNDGTRRPAAERVVLPDAASGPGPASLAAAIDTRRKLAGVLLTVAGLPLLTALLIQGRPHLNLADDLLIYLVAVVAIAVTGGFWPAVLAAVAASLLLNWFFTPPLHTFTIEEPTSLLALLLFVTVAVAVSSVVHLAARRALQAAHSREEAASLLALARTVLGGADTPAAVLDHLTRTLGGSAELRERVAGRWVRVAGSGTDPGVPGATRIDPRDDLSLNVTGRARAASPGLLAGFAAQAAAALDRERLRTQAAQAEALAEGNRMRTALLAAVSHDLRTPLASIKASASSLRQTDVQWSADDQADLLATIEQNADRLDTLIGNLLDMSRLHTNSLQPFLRPTAVDEVAPVALRGLGTAASLRMVVPDGLPLVHADPGLLERVLANLFSNALRYSPPSRPPALRAYQRGGTVVLEVIDHGRGVPGEAKQRIFEPFQRLDDRPSGVGLGLAVAKGFTEAMGGSISAADTPGGGLTIRVALPASASEMSPVLEAGP